MTNIDWKDAQKRADEIEDWAVRTGRVPKRQFHTDGTPVWGQPVRVITEAHVQEFYREHPLGRRDNA